MHTTKPTNAQVNRSTGTISSQGNSMERKLMLDGDIPTIVVNGVKHYTTNYGTADIRTDGSIDFVSIRLQKYSVRIDGNQFLIYQLDNNGQPVCGIKSDRYQFFMDYVSYHGFILSDFLDAVIRDKNYHYLSNRVKLTIVYLLQRHFKLSRGELNKIKQTIKLLRRPSVSVRTPILSSI